MSKEEKIPAENKKIKIDDSSLTGVTKKKTTIKPSEAEIEEIKTLWEKFHKGILDKIKKKSED
jgi:hypothetical protein